MSEKPPVFPDEFLRKYEVLRVLGEGGVGRVVLARDRELDRKVAAKFLLDGAFASKSDLDRFAEEARVCGHLSHPNIVPLYSIGGETTKTPYLVFAYVEGFDISERIREQKQLKFEETVTWFREVLAGLSHAHAKGIIHRDIKPNNVRVNGEGQAMIMDFGMAKARSGRSFQTRVGLVLGTPLYIAPEVLRGQPATPVTDVYSVGCSLYECLSGRPPHVADDPMKVLEMQLKVEPEPIESLRPDAPRALCDVIGRALSKRPEERYQSAAELSEALARSLNPQRSDPSLKRIPPGSRPRGGTGKNQRVTARGGQVATIAYPMPERPRHFHAMLAACALAGAAIAGAFAWINRPPPDLGAVRVSIDARGLAVTWGKSPGALKIELAGDGASEIKEVAGDAPPRALLPVPATGKRTLRVSEAGGRVLWERPFEIPANIEPKVDFVGASGGREVRVELSDTPAKRAGLYVATADGDAQAPVGKADAEDRRIQILGQLVGDLPRLRLELELADGVTLARLIDQDELRLRRLTALLDRASLEPLIAIARDKTLYDGHLHWLPDNKPGEVQIDNLASVQLRGLGSRAPRAKELPAKLDEAAFPEPLGAELAWLRAEHARVMSSKAISPETIRRLYLAVMRTVEPRDRLLTGQYRTHRPISHEVLAPVVKNVYAVPPPAEPPPDAIPIVSKVLLWRDKEGIAELGFNTWDVAYPHMELAFGKGFRENPDAQMDAAVSRRELPVDIPPAWRAGRFAIGADVAILPAAYGLEIEIKGATGEVLPLRFTQPGNPLWYLIMDGWSRKAAPSLGLADWVDPVARAEGEGHEAKEFEQTLEWGAVRVEVPGAWLPARPKSIAITYCLPLGLGTRALRARQRAMFTRKIWMAPAAP